MYAKNARFVNNLLAIAVAGSTAILSASAAVSAEPEHLNLTGTWVVTVQQYDCSSGTDLGQPFPSFLSFGPGGILIETTSNPGFAPGQRGPGHGTWKRIRFDEFRAVSEAFILFSTPAHGPVPAFATGRQRIEQDIDYMGGEQFTSKAIVSFTDPSGMTVLHSGCAHASGVRMTD